MCALFLCLRNPFFRTRHVRLLTNITPFTRTHCYKCIYFCWFAGTLSSYLSFTVMELWAIKVTAFELSLGLLSLTVRSDVLLLLGHKATHYFFKYMDHMNESWLINSPISKRVRLSHLYLSIYIPSIHTSPDSKWWYDALILSTCTYPILGGPG